MTARLGADDLELFENPQPRLLREATGIEPERSGLHVLLDTHGVQSTQRLALSEFGGGLVAALWPAELRPQAEYLYGAGLATPMIAAARERGWSAEPSPHSGAMRVSAACSVWGSTCSRPGSERRMARTDPTSLTVPRAMSGDRLVGSPLLVIVTGMPSGKTTIAEACRNTFSCRSSRRMKSTSIGSV
jgi:hypothetical protein